MKLYQVIAHHLAICHLSANSGEMKGASDALNAICIHCLPECFLGTKLKWHICRADPAFAITLITLGQDHRTFVLRPHFIDGFTLRHNSNDQQLGDVLNHVLRLTHACDPTA